MTAQPDDDTVLNDDCTHCRILFCLASCYTCCGNRFIHINTQVFPPEQKSTDEKIFIGAQNLYAKSYADCNQHKINVSYTFATFSLPSRLSLSAPGFHWISHTQEAYRSRALTAGWELHPAPKELYSVEKL